MSTTQRVPDYPPSEDPQHGSVASSAYADQPQGQGPEHPFGPVRAILRRWWIVAIVLVVFVGGAAYAAYKQAPTYTSTGQYNVGRTDVRVQALPGYVQGALGLATAYSRIATSDEIVVPLARETGLTADEVRSRLEVFPVAGSPIFTIQGSAPTPAGARDFTRKAMDRIETYVVESDSGDRSLSDMLASYERLSRTVASYQRRIDDAVGRRASVRAGGDGTAPSLASIDRLRAKRDTAQLRVSTLQTEYQNRSDETTSTAGLQEIGTPTTTFDDRRQTYQRLIAVGLLAGVVVGSALALLYDRRRLRRVAAA